MNYVVTLGKEIFRKRKLILDLGKADFRKRFVGSYFGVVWMFIQPVVTVAIYAFVFGESGFALPRRFREPPMWSGWFRALCPGFFTVRR